VLVLLELINMLKRINDAELRGGPKLSIEKNVQALLSLPIVWLDMDLAVIERASTYAFRVNGVDYVHIASMEINSMTEIVSADRELDKVRMISRIDPLNYGRA
jgi:predicted nucleic acid-binding protein